MKVPSILQHLCKYTKNMVTQNETIGHLSIYMTKVTASD